MRAEVPVTEFSEFPPAYPFSGKHAGKDHVKDRRFVVHATGRDTENRNGIAGKPKREDSLAS
jgi:hypothetical protein